VPARYYEGDDWLPGNLPAAQIRDLQQRMVNAGLIPKGAEYRVGYWDDVSRQAYRQLLAEANGSGLSAELQLKTRENTQQLANQKKYVAPAYLKPSPATMREAVRSAMSTIVGPDHALNDQELDHLTGVLASFDRKHYDATVTADRQGFDAAQQGDGGGGGTVQDVDPAAAFDDYLRTRYKPEIQRNEGVADMAASRNNLLAGVFSLDKAIGA
jgi:hypothetical protein